METIRLGYDDNLGIPSDFAKTVKCDVIAHHDLSQMISDFENRNLSAMFIPAGTLPYIKKYEIISQALFGQEHLINLETDFVTKKNISVNEIPNFNLGRVNQFCTTSFWAPLIYLMDYLPKNTQLKFQDTNGFQDMLFKTAEGVIDACMIWNIFLKKNPNAASQVHQLFKKTDLPTPVIVTKTNLPVKTIDLINQFKSEDTNAFFPGFHAPNMAGINKFLIDMRKASQFFNLEKESATLFF